MDEPATLAMSMLKLELERWELAINQGNGNCECFVDCLSLFDRRHGWDSGFVGWWSGGDWDKHGLTVARQRELSDPHQREQSDPRQRRDRQRCIFTIWCYLMRKFIHY